MTGGQHLRAVAAARAVRVLSAGLAEALTDIHRAGLAHRDLKPGNVMLTATEPRPIDFGIARPEDATTITRAGAVRGTLGFMAPEQAEGKRSGQPADVFCLGAVLVYARSVSRHSPPAPRSRRRTSPGSRTVPLREVVVACLPRDPERRPLATELLDRLSHVPEVGTG